MWTLSQCAGNSGNDTHIEPLWWKQATCKSAKNLVLDMPSGVLIPITTEALRVQGMSPEARWIWLQQTWGRLQDSAAFLRPDDQPMPGAARCYATLNEKNRFDEDREIRQALKMSMRMAHQS
jgi:hypothetical protein